MARFGSPHKIDTSEKSRFVCVGCGSVVWRLKNRDPNLVFCTNSCRKENETKETRNTRLKGERERRTRETERRRNKQREAEIRRVRRKRTHRERLERIRRSSKKLIAEYNARLEEARRRDLSLKRLRMLEELRQDIAWVDDSPPELQTGCYWTERFPTLDEIDRGITLDEELRPLPMNY